MGLLRPSRAARGPDPYLRWKVALFLGGAALGLAGMALNTAWLLGPALALIMAGIVLRFLPRRSD